jgi:hypothetical protein
MINFLILILFLIVVYGISNISNKIFSINSNGTILYDFFSGIHFIIFLSLILNFFIPLNLVSYLITIIGIFFFFRNISNLNFNFFVLIFILGIFYYISLSNGLAVDSKTYHLQIIEKFSSNKIIIGFSNLDFRYGSASPWHLMMSAFYFDFKSIKLIYYINITLLSILVFECLKKKNNYKIEKLFLLFSIFFLILYSIVHPSGNGMILTLMGSPDLDFPGMILFITAIYFFFLSYRKKEIRDYLLIVSTLCFFAKLSYIASTLLILRFIILEKNFYKNRLFLLNILIISLWVIRNILISGCAIYPVMFSCLNNLPWSNILGVELWNNILTSYARDIGPRDQFMNFEYTLNSTEWFIPWLKFYLLQNSLIQSFLILSIIFIFLLSFIKLKKKKFIYSKKINFVIIILLSSLLIWIKALDIRYILGILISLVSITSILIFINIKFLKKFNKYFNFILIVLIFLILTKNWDNYKFINKFNNENIYSNKTEIFNEKFNIIKPVNNSFCLDVNEFCIYNEKDYKIRKIQNYNLIYKAQ